MPNYIIAWDIETIPDLKGFAAANGYERLTESGFQASESNLAEFIKMRGNTKPHGIGRLSLFL
jgi:hypothetical protein